jgi:hypothetical protein
MIKQHHPKSKNHPLFLTTDSGYKSCAGRQFDDEFRSLRLVVPHPDKPVMIRNNGADNGKPQAGSMFFGGKIGLKQPCTLFFESMPGPLSATSMRTIFRTVS